MAPMSEQKEGSSALYGEAVQRLRCLARADRNGTMVAEGLHPKGPCTHIVYNLA